MVEIRPLIYHFHYFKGHHLVLVVTWVLSWFAYQLFGMGEKTISKKTIVNLKVPITK